MNKDLSENIILVHPLGQVDIWILLSFHRFPILKICPTY